MTKPDLKATMQKIAEQRAAVNVARGAAEHLLSTIRDQLVGRRINPHRSGNLKGEYEITDVDLNWDTTIQAHGRKVTANGKLGSQRWDLGEIYPGKLGL